MQAEAERENLLAKKADLESRLQDIIGPPLPSDANPPLVREEAHWDCVMKELVSDILLKLITLVTILTDMASE